MSLPIKNLDDRRFQDLVDEAKRLIPKYCPEWTNHNVSDPGVALIELFAWMTELAIFRLNQVPDRFYTHMLNLVGFEPFPATPARTDITFWLAAPTEEPVEVPKDTLVSTRGTIGEPRTFSTMENLVITQPRLIGAISTTGPDTYVDGWDRLRADTSSFVCFPGEKLEAGDAFFLRFEGSLAGMALQLDITAPVEGRGIDPTDPPLAWHVWGGTYEEWVPVHVYADTTGGLNRKGRLVLLVPRVHQAQTLDGKQGFWLRAQLITPEDPDKFYDASPQINTLRVLAVGGSVEAEHSAPVVDEFLGNSTGQPDQVFRTGQFPVLPRNLEFGETVVVSHEGEDEAWTEVADFVDSSEHDTHYTWSSTTGEIRFGPRIRYPDVKARYKQHGKIPPAGARVTVARYRHGGGYAGNVGAGTLTSLHTTIKHIARAENATAATGGVDGESVPEAKLRAPMQVRAGSRAVTAPDFERLTLQADPSIARVRCLKPQQPDDPIRLLIVPHVDQEADKLQIDQFALPTAMVRTVSEFLEDRRVLGSTIELRPPFYQGVSIAALVTARPNRPKEVVAQVVEEALYRFLSPFEGGPDGEGWPFETDLNAATIFQELEEVDGVERVDEVYFFEYDLRNDIRRGTAQEVIKLGRDSLFLSARHKVVVR